MAYFAANHELCPFPVSIIVAEIARFMKPRWGPSGANRTQVGPMLAPWTLLSGGLVPVYAGFYKTHEELKLISLWCISWYLVVDPYSINAVYFHKNTTYLIKLPNRWKSKYTKEIRINQIYISLFIYNQFKVVNRLKLQLAAMSDPVYSTSRNWDYVLYIRISIIREGNLKIACS